MPKLGTRRKEHPVTDPRVQRILEITTSAYHQPQRVVTHMAHSRFPDGSEKWIAESRDRHGISVMSAGKSEEDALNNLLIHVETHMEPSTVKTLNLLSEWSPSHV